MHGWTERRGLVLEAVGAVPGSHLRSLERICRMPLGTLRYHLGLLVEERAVAVEHDRRFRRFYPAAMERRARRVWDALRQRETRKLVVALMEAPATQAELGHLLRLAPSTMHRYARRLKDLGLVAEAAGQLALYQPTYVAAVLEQVNPTRLDLLTDGAIGLFDDLER